MSTPTTSQSTTPDTGGHLSACEAALDNDRNWIQYRVCSNCGHHARIGAWDRVKMLLDGGSFSEIHSDLVSVDPLEFSDSRPYRERVIQARERTGMKEAVLTGRGKIRGHEIIIAVVDFGFLGGSMGSVAGEKIALAFEEAIDRKLPIVTVVASGGARMQEGMLSLVQMAKTAAAARRAHERRIPYISILTDPTTGGMYASYASQGDVILAEPGALIGFAGPRVIAGTMEDRGDGEAEKTHTPDYLLDHGFLDAIVSRVRLRDTLTTILRVIARSHRSLPNVREPHVDKQQLEAEDAWDIVQIARRDDRPTTLDYIRRISPQFVELHGDRTFGDDPAIICGLGEVAGRGVVFVGLERGHDDESRRGGQALPEGYRKALRALRLAERFGCPVVTFIDTPGAYLGIESEARGLASALSECLAKMSVLRVPIVSIIIGEGGSGGALALGVGDRILMLEHAIYSVIAPEGAAAILFRDPKRAPEVAEALKLTARDCVRLGVADKLVSEPDGGAHVDPDFAASLVRDALTWALSDIDDSDGSRLVESRYRKFRRMGQMNTYWREALSREAGAVGTRFTQTIDYIRDRLTGSDGADDDNDERSQRAEANT
ncbi:MAG: acetyl-CoA carboxylase carboxyltransferase subunit alpha/beta [Thermomicrobiales bacterium]